MFDKHSPAFWKQDRFHTVVSGMRSGS